MCIFTITRKNLKAEKFSDVETTNADSINNQELDLILVSALKKLAS